MAFSIALLLDSAPRTWTSQEDLHLHLCRALIERGAHLTLVYATTLKPEIANRYIECGAAVEAAPYYKVFDYRRALSEIIRKHSVSLVHVCFFDYFSAVPWVVRLNGPRNIIFEQLNSGVLRATSWKRKLIQLRGAAATWPAKRVVAISQFVKDELVKSGVNKNKIIVRRLGVDIERFQPDRNARESLVQKYNIKDNELILSTVSVLRTFKRPEVIIESCGLLHSRGVPFRLFVGGDGDLLPGLKQLSEKLGCADRIHWLGYCPDPKPLLQASDVFVLASVGEAFGLVLTEAMACGVPVVGSRSGAIPEIVEDGATGLLAEPMNAASFADAIERLATNRDELKRMSVNCRSRVENQFSVDHYVKHTLQIYDALSESR